MSVNPSTYNLGGGGHFRLMYVLQVYYIKLLLNTSEYLECTEQDSIYSGISNLLFNFYMFKNTLFFLINLVIIIFVTFLYCYCNCKSIDKLHQLTMKNSNLKWYRFYELSVTVD